MTTGETCHTKCSSDTWGYNCSQPCQCQNDTSCNHVNGNCNCTSGWMGSSCSELTFMAKIANNNVTVNLMTVTPGMEVVSVQRVGLDFDVIRVVSLDFMAVIVKIGVTVNVQFVIALMAHVIALLDGLEVIAAKFVLACDFIALKHVCLGKRAGRQLADCPKGSFGKRCQNSCNCKFHCHPVTGSCICPVGWTKCDHMTGNCSCTSGWTGNMCSERRCSLIAFCSHVLLASTVKTANTIAAANSMTAIDLMVLVFYGPNCQLQCHCQQGTCDRFDGRCTCLSGWTGDDCSQACKPGFFGRNCQEKCSCKRGSCDRFRGTCDCPAG
ncbi:protein draper-like [Corticium candelabrum]|uniref:protein draper-like n=1 Tax=Corticium candelabrum TaxID=121492 RepID=UPI002E256B8F|nr:protein draper-like [Corticium candelabrum]